MEKDSDAFSRRLLLTFKGEAEEHIRTLGVGFMALEQGDRAVVESLFREAHSLKGAARAVGQTGMEGVCQSVESVLAAVKAGSLAVAPELLDLLHQSVDALSAFLAAVDGEVPLALAATAKALRRNLAGAASRAAPVPLPAGGQVAPPLVRSEEALPRQESLRVEVARLDAVLFEAEVLVGARLAVRQHEAELRAAAQVFVARRREWTRAQPAYLRLRRPRPGSAQQGLEGLVDYLAGEDAFLREFGARLSTLHKATQQRGRNLTGMVDSLLGDMKKLLLVPLASAVDILPRLVRDLARDLGKEAEFQASGAELEIDRRILDALRDPLVHLVRNCVDHGIETPEARRAAGKPPRGIVSFAASEVEGGRVELRIGDDGAGIDLAKVRAATRHLGLRPPAEAGQEWLLSQVFRSGLSTSDCISDISGRGLGLAIVREKVERLGGTVTVESGPGQGSTFRLVLPVALASFHGVRVRAAGEEFIFPSMGVGLVVRLPRDNVKTVESRETISLEGRAVALVRLADVLELSGAGAPRGSSLSVVMAGKGDARMAFAVDEVIEEQEVLVKSLGRQLRRVRNIAGATVLGSGQVVPILYLPDLLLSARQATPRPARLDAEAALAPPGEAPLLLVAEDSITSRLLLKGILEAAGYRVITAADGAEALARLPTEAVDLVVSDVDMPRLNGFELTARIRADKRLADLPVVLVTSLDKREDREQGAEAGANAYIVKGSFEQDTLLAALRRLL